MPKGSNPDPYHVNIVEKFYCDETGQPFQNCIECEEELIQSNKHYFIEKAIRKYPNTSDELTVFEFAICISCATKMNQCLSKDSLNSLINYQNKKKRQHLNTERFYTVQKRNVSDRLNQCVYSGIPIEEFDEYQIVGAFTGNQMITEDFPIAISGTEIELISELLSEETKEEFDDFIAKHFNGPPELQELWGKPKLILV
ncbi:MAG: hypothetical protein HOL28_02800 [Crocinitomicaceae bacterium]|jgi:hypothetical protein|nr:hypothetical protein [Crocinitomicaceae bacterium]MBT6514674.1 hypothetical protein [Crocinitomicaceae bacterium]